MHACPACGVKWSEICYMDTARALIQGVICIVLHWKGIEFWSRDKGDCIPNCATTTPACSNLFYWKASVLFVYSFNLPLL
jgi:hypothetical protein